MTQEFKSIEEIKNDIIQETLKHGVGGLEEFTTEVSQRYAKQYIDTNKELQNKIDWQKEFIEKQDFIIDALKGGNEARKQINKELVEILEKIVYIKEETDLDFTIDSIKKLITKHKQS